jgi:hypothetical protein
VAEDDINILKRKLMVAYLNIDDEIAWHEETILRLQDYFYDNSLVGYSCEFNGRMIIKRFDLEKVVIDYLTHVETYIAKIRVLEQKKKYVQAFMKQLTKRQQTALKKALRTYSKLTGIERKFYDEIQEIEQAINYMRGFKPEVNTDHLDMCEFNLDDNFTEAIKLLAESD